MINHSSFISVVRVLTLSFFFSDRFAEAGDDDEDSEGDETIERVIERLRDVNHSYLEKSKQVWFHGSISMSFK